MNNFFISRAEVRAFDQHAIEKLGIPGPVLMENAGRGAAEILHSIRKRGLVIVCCGKGNNGGDGLVMARHLANHDSSEILVLLFSRENELSSDAALEWRIVKNMGLPTQVWADMIFNETKLAAVFARADWIVDALFGTGLTGPVRPPLDHVIDLINASGKRVLAVDIPSGLDCDTGESLGATIHAERTVTFVERKLGFRNPASEQYTGEVHVVDIGIGMQFGK